MRCMIQETMTQRCRGGGSPILVKSGSPHYHGKECRVYRVLKPKQPDSEAEQQRVVQACSERCSLRGVERIFDSARQAVA